MQVALIKNFWRNDFIPDIATASYHETTYTWDKMYIEHDMCIFIKYLSLWLSQSNTALIHYELVGNSMAHADGCVLGFRARPVAGWASIESAV